MSAGRFITFEGIDGAGKTTQIDALQSWLTGHGVTVVRTREPGGTVLGEKIRALLLHDEMDALTETLLFFAARADHIARRIAPALAAGHWVLSDRFTDATYAYQVGGKGLSAQTVLQLETLVQGGLQPDHTVLFDLDPRIAAQRLAASRSADRFEALELAFFERVRAAYVRRSEADPQRFFRVDAALPPEQITRQLCLEVQQWL